MCVCATHIMHVCIYIYMCVCVTYIYIYIYTVYYTVMYITCTRSIY